MEKQRYETNFAVQIEPDHIIDDVDLEAGITSSRCHLMHNFEEEKPITLVESLHESARSSVRKLKFYICFVFNPIKKLLLSAKLLILIALYSILGAHLFMWLEVPTNLAAKEETYHQRLIARENLVLNLRTIYIENRENREERWKQSIIQFERELQFDDLEDEITTDWTFWMSFLYAGTIFTTIGYGNIACKTRAGQTATMIYAFVGIPIMLFMLTSLNNFLLKWIRIIAEFTSGLWLWIGVKMGFTTLQEDSKERSRYQAFNKKLAKMGIISGSDLTLADSMGTLIDEKKLGSIVSENENDEEEQIDPPVMATLFVTVSWIMLSAWVFCLFEDWSFFTSFYFCYISLTTIGLGDVTPANPEYMMFLFGIVIIGLSMLTVCIDVIKEKIAQMYMALLRKLLKDYMDAVRNGDPNATSAMMSGFQGKAKFLMPLLSKSEGAKVMNKFKTECTKKGIDPPSVLTDINPETGMPAFATANKQEFMDYIEVAEEKKAEERRLLTPEPRNLTSKGISTEPYREVVKGKDMSSQTRPMEDVIVRYSMQTQAGAGLLVQSSMETKILEDAKVTMIPLTSTPIQSEPIISEACAQTAITMCELGGKFFRPAQNSVFQTACSTMDRNEVFSQTHYDTAETFCQTDNESSDEGIQTDFSGLDEEVQTSVDCEEFGVQHDTLIEKDTCEQGTQMLVQSFTETGIQPEFSSIFRPSDVYVDSTSEESSEFSDIDSEEDETLCLEDVDPEHNSVVDDVRDAPEVLEIRNTKRNEVSENIDVSPEPEKEKSVKSTEKEVAKQSKVLDDPKNNVDNTESHLAEEKKLDLEQSGKHLLTAIERKPDEKPVKQIEQLLSKAISIEVIEENEERASTDDVAPSSVNLLSAVKMSDIGKSISVESAETVVNVGERPSDEKKKLTNAEKMKKKKEHLAKRKAREARREARRQTQDLRFMKSVGNQITPALEQTAIQCASTSLETATQVAVTTKGRRTQTTLSNMNREQEQRRRERIEQRRKEADEESEPRSRKSTSSIATSTGEEVNLNVTMLSVGVDEEGNRVEYVEYPPPVSDEDESEEEIELFVTEIETQTEELKMVNQETSATSSLLDLLCTTTTQTSISAVKEVENRNEVAEESENIYFMESSGVQTMATHAYATTDDVDEKYEEQLLFLADSSTQTSMQMTSTQISTLPMTTSTDVQTIPPPRIIDNGSQTKSKEFEESATQTVYQKTLTAVQTETITRNSDAQTEVVRVKTSSTETIEERKILVGEETQTEREQSESKSIQAEQDFEIAEVQATVTQRTSGTQSEASTFVVDQSNRSKMEGAYGVRFLEETSTQYEDQIKTISHGTQSDEKQRDEAITQATAETVTSSTQHTTTVASRDTQTETLLKDRSSQDDRSTSPILFTTTTGSGPDRDFTMTDQETDVQSLKSDSTWELPKDTGAGPLWSDFDYVEPEDEEEVEETSVERDQQTTPPPETVLRSQQTSPEPVTITEDTVCQVAPTMVDQQIEFGPVTETKKIQTVKFKKKREEKEVDATVVTVSQDVQAVVDTVEQEAGFGENDNDDWLQVYVNELDEERRLRMADIGIQTGVLARVQHIYTLPISDDQPSASTTAAPMTVRKHKTEELAPRSEKQLSRSTSAVSIADSVDTEGSSSRPPSRRESVKKPRKIRDEERNVSRAHLVTGLRAKFEEKK